MLNLEFKTFLGFFQKIQNLISKEIAVKIIFFLAHFLISLVTTQAVAFGKYAPFSIAFVAAVPKNMLIVSALGSAIGYLLPSPAYLPFRYIIVLGTVAALRWALAELKKLNNNDFFAPTIAFVPLCATGVILALINNSAAPTLALYLAESFLAAGSAFFFNKGITIFTKRRYRMKLDNVGIASLSVAFAIVILSLSEIEILTISIGRILMVLFILISARAGSIAGGAISGVSAGAISGLSSLGLSYLSGAYGLGGLMAGIFSSNKFLSTIAFIVAHGVASLQISDMTNVFDSVVEVAIASVIFMVLPETNIFKEFFNLKKDSYSENSMKSNIIMKLNHSSRALLGVSQTVTEISEKLTNSTSANVTQVYNKSAAEICAACGMRALCWSKNKDETIKYFCELTAPLKSKDKLENNDFNEKFRKRCNRVGEMRESINKYYRLFLAKQREEIRMANFRDIAGEQFKVTSAMLTDMANDVSQYEGFDDEISEKVELVFRKFEIYSYEISSRRDNHGKIIIECEIDREDKSKINKVKLTREISRACGKAFSAPCISLAENTCKITMCQKSVLEVSVGLAQSSADKLCGDSVSTFYDGQGKYISIICDGMGTGGLAAVDGTMASTVMESLLKAGMGYDTALRLINSALMAKSEDETLATVDIATLDLFSGICEFRKAGAALSVIRRGKKVIFIEKNSLPIGIVQDVKFDMSSETLKVGDIICLVSDGVTALGQDWLEETVFNFMDTDPNILAKDIVGYAKRNRNDGHSDDITALVIMVTDNL